jgi:hypothetical protein
MASTSQYRLQKVADLAARKSDDPTRHRCFVSYHVDDTDEVEQFLADLGHVMIATVVGVTEEDDFVDSDDTDYIMDRIREKYLSTTTVTIVMVGTCTWARKFVDWEIYSSLRNYKTYKPSGLMAITLPSMTGVIGRTPPARVDDNISGDDNDEGYARWWKYPSSASALQAHIETAFTYRTTRDDFIDNSRARRTYNSSC